MPVTRTRTIYPSKEYPSSIGDGDSLSRALAVLQNIDKMSPVGPDMNSTARVFGVDGLRVEVTDILSEQQVQAIHLAEVLARLREVAQDRDKGGLDHDAVIVLLAKLEATTL
jgi:hypothetical protein